MKNVLDLIRHDVIHTMRTRDPSTQFLLVLLAISARLTLSQENMAKISHTSAPSILSRDNTSSSLSFHPSEAPSITPTTISPTISASPTINYNEICPNSAGWKRLGRPWEIMDWRTEFSCDDEEVRCFDFGSLGRASLHCCKCRPVCCGRCNVTCVVETNPPQQQPSSSPGYKYDYKGSGRSSSSSSSTWNWKPGPRHGALVIVVFFVSVIWCCNREQQSLRRTRRTMNHRRRQNNTNDNSQNDGEEISEERYQLFRSKFHFEDVPTDAHAGESESKMASNRSPGSLVREHSSTSSKSKSTKDTDDDEVKVKYVKGPVDLENSLKSVGSSTSDGGYRPFASLKRIPARGECAICLDGYHPGETVCIAVNEVCNHVYHQECVVEWLKKNDRCPCCRTVLMK